jgi:hypothetical protein
MHDESNNPQRNPLEQALASLTPTAQFARDELFFAAGRAAGERAAALAQANWRRRAWPLSTAALALLSAGLSAALVTRSPRTEIVYVERPATIQQEANAVVLAPPANAAPVERVAETQRRTNSEFPPASYASLRDQALRGEFERRPATENGTPAQESVPAADPPSYRALRDALLETAG